jgi:hypothetical protein
VHVRNLVELNLINAAYCVKCKSNGFHLFLFDVSCFSVTKTSVDFITSTVDLAWKFYFRFALSEGG